MISDVENLLMYLMAICMSSSEKVSSDSLPIFKLGYLGGFLLLSCMSSFYQLIGHNLLI